MDVTIHYEPAKPRERVVLHAWEPAGNVWDIEGQPGPDGRFTFSLTGDTVDPRDVSFKYRFPLESEAWESDDFVRHVPTREARQEIWTFDYTPRCLRRDPYAGAAPGTIRIHAVTRARFAGGRVFVWNPRAEGGERESFPETSRANEISDFVIPARPWMRDGFHFKLVGPGRDGNDWEEDRSNRVWRPSDGGEFWIKSGQVGLRPELLSLATTTIDLIYPRTVDAPTLWLNDLGEAFHAPLERQSIEELDTEFRVARDAAQVYPNALYEIHTGESDPPFWCKYRVWQDDPLPRSPSTALLGVYRWLDARPRRDARVRLVIHRNPDSQFGERVNLAIATGETPSDNRTAPQPPFAHLVAGRQGDGTWVAEFDVFANLPHSVALEETGGFAEAPPETLVKSLRTFAAPPGGPTTLHTADGVKGISSASGPDFAEVPIDLRRDVMASAFTRAAVEKGVFDREELPHGATFHDGDVWFVLYAPHAVTASLLVLEQDGEGGTRRVREHPMQLTHDLRYWWLRVPQASAPHGTHYRYLLNGTTEALDPAARWFRDEGRLYPKNGEGLQGPWAQVADPAVIRQPFAGSPWRTLGWEALLIYEMHPLRLTRRNQAGGQPVGAFEQIIAELQPGKYLHELGVTALEYMPVHEFPGRLSWGYNPSGFFAIDTAYGGPEGLARSVRAAHDAGKGVMLDIVFNHLSESPLQHVARDVYVDGETNWGDMVNYDHPRVVEFFRQALIALWQTYELDGFRFDATRAIIDGHIYNGYIMRSPGSGGGWEFMKALRRAIRDAADALGRPWPYLVGENDPTNWGMTDPDPSHPGVLDGQWHFEHHYRLGDAAWNREDRAIEIRDQMNWPHNALRPYYETVRYAESHDSTSAQEGWKQRVADRAPDGEGRRMAKALTAASVLAMGIPMVFMGEEAGEDTPFWFGMDALDLEDRYLPLEEYEGREIDPSRVLTWCRHLMGLRNDPSAGFRGNDHQVVGYGSKTVAFTRAHGRFFVVATFGTPNTEQNSGWLGLPGGTAYKEIFNSAWDEYQVEWEPRVTNGGYNASIYSGELLHLPAIGAVVLERQ